MVMERVTGMVMLDHLVRHPTALRQDALMLGDLHDQLHQIPAPEWLPDLGDGDALLHLDLHPANVMMTARGPVVIDWTNAGRGHPLTDVGLTYVVLVCPDVPAPRPVRILVQPFRQIFAGWFGRRYRGAAFDEHTAFAAELKMCDSNMSPVEVARCKKLAARLRPRVL